MRHTMKEVLIIGSGISGMSCAVRCAAHGMKVRLVSPAPSERSQSVMAAGGINAVTPEHEDGDSVALHIGDTLRGGGFLGGRNAVEGLCSHAGEIISYLESIGTVFTVNDKGRPMLRAFGGQSRRRTHYCGSSTGKQIVSALVMEVRRFEAAGLITRVMRVYFHSALIYDGVCYGVLLYDEKNRSLFPVYADAVIIAAGGMNSLFGKTTGSSGCDGYAAGKLFMQGAALKNLEFIQFHPTTLETPQKRMLISEAVRGEGGRLFYLHNGRRVYFMEDKYGANGNLMTRDIVSREIASAGEEVFLDISFMDSRLIGERLPEVRDLCMKYRGIDISAEPVPVAPSVHFFMGGLAVHLNHETNIRRLYAVGECASMYHGANRLGGNSLLSAIYSGRTAADDIAGRSIDGKRPDAGSYIRREQELLSDMLSSQSTFTAMYIRSSLAAVMREHMGIVRSESSLQKGIEDTDFYLAAADRIRYDASESAYTNFSLRPILTLARAALTSASFRAESRGAHFRSDHQESSEEYGYATLCSYDNGAYRVSLDKEMEYEN